MYTSSLLFALPLLATAALIGSLALYAFHHATRKPGALTFGLLMTAVSEWVACYALELLISDLPGKVLAAKLEYLGITAIPPLWLAFALRYTGHAAWLTHGHRLLLAAPGVLTFALVLTNDRHHLIWTGVGLDPDGAPALHIAGRGAWFWVHTLTAYLFILAGVVLYVLAWIRAARTYRQQVSVMLLGALLPLTGNGLYLAGLSPVPWLDLTPFIFALAGGMLAIGLFRFSLLDLMPIAAPMVIEGLQDAVIVVDTFNRVTDLNPAARQLFGIGDEAIGCNVLYVLWPTATIRQYTEITERQMELEIGVGDTRRAFQLTISPIHYNRRQLVGRLLVLRDVTREHELLKAEQEQRELAEALWRAGLALSESLNLETVLDRLLDEVGRVVPYDAANIMLVEPSAQSRLGRTRIARMRGYEQFGEAVARDIAALSLEIETTENLRRMAETRQPLIIPDTATYPGWIKVEASAHVHSWAGAPIVARGQVVAFFSLDKDEPGYYRPEHAERLAAFAGQAAIAIENAQLYESSRRQAEEQRQLYEAVRDFTAGLDEEGVLRAIARHMVEAMRVPCTTILRWDPASDRVVTQLDYGITTDHGPDDVPGTAYSLADYPATRRVLETLQPLLVRADDPAADPAERVLLKEYGYSMLLMLPLVAGSEQAFGLIELYREPGAPAFTPSDVQLAQNLTAQAAIALENARLHAAVQALAVTDSLTGLTNRRAFDRGLEAEFLRAGRYGYPLSLVILDIDDFKVYNDTYGHLAGDERLKAIATLLRENVRDPDVAARYGGDEFALILPHTDRAGALMLAERIRAAAAAAVPQRPNVATSERSNAPVPGYTLSLGMAVFPEDAQTAEALLRAADDAELAAKRAGKNRVCLASQNQIDVTREA